MDADKFLAQFETVIQTPGGIGRLRSFILEMAVRGALAEQDTSDESPSIELDRVRSQKGPVVNAKVTGRATVPRVPEEWERSFGAPEGWCWARLDDLADYINGLPFGESTWTDVGIPIIRIQNLTNPSAPFNCTDLDVPIDRHVSNGDILVSWSATLEAFLWDRDPGVLNQHIFKVVPNQALVDRAFLFHLLRHSIRRLASSSAAHGLAMKHINRGPFVSLPIALPPIGEQKRIVSKISELLALCDQMEAAQVAKLALAGRARASILASLISHHEEGDVARDWERASRSWGLVIGGSDEADDLRQLILDLGSAGLLATRGVGDEPADTILGETEATNLELVGQGLIRKPKPPPPVDSDAVPFDLPEGWIWARLGAVLSQCRNGLAVSPNENGIGYRMLRISAGTSRRDFVTDISDVKFADVSSGQAAPFTVQPGDLLACRFNGNRRFVGRVSQVPADVGGGLLHPDKLIVLRAPVVRHDYLRIVLNSSLIRKQIDEVASTMAGNVGINGRQLQSLLVPIAPVAEQLRIIALVDQMIGQVAIIEVAGQSRDELAAEFSAAAVAYLASSDDVVETRSA